MTNEQRIKNLSVPQGRVDVVLDTTSLQFLTCLSRKKS